MTACNIPPAGWSCTRVAGHDGPCAAVAKPPSMAGWASPTLGRAYVEIDKLRTNLAQNSESGIDESLRRALESIETADCELMGMVA